MPTKSPTAVSAIRSRLNRPGLCPPIRRSPSRRVSNAVFVRSPLLSKRKSQSTRNRTASCLGIVSPDEAGLSPETTAPDVKFHTMPNFALEAEFRKYDLDALRVEFRHKGGNWQLAAILTSSPGVFNVVPNETGNAEQIEIRAIFIEKNQNFGIFSPIYTVVIQP